MNKPPPDRTLQPDRQVKVSIVTPAFNEEPNLPLFYDRLRATLDGLGVDWEWIVVDDHSVDGTLAVVERLAAKDRRVRGVSFSRNFGSHMAMVCGLSRAVGDCAVFLAADLQDPPEVIPDLLSKWREGSQVVWASRRSRHGESAGTRAFSRLYWFLMRRVVGFKQTAATGADFFLIGRSALNVLNRMDEANVNAFSLITWLGFSQTSVAYDKQPRLHGRSSWTLARKVKLVIDSITAYSYLPMRAMSATGLLMGTAGLASGVLAFLRYLGVWAGGAGLPLIVAVLMVGFGLVLLSLGILGEYLWRALEQVNGRPRYVVERVIEGSQGGQSQTPISASVPRMTTPEGARTHEPEPILFQQASG